MSAVPTLDARLDWLRRFRDGVRLHHEELVELASDEVGKPRFEALAADIMPLVASCNWHLRNGRRLLRARRVGGGGLFGLGHRVERRRVPAGRVLVIATWNYPVQLLGIQLVQAVVAGNAVVVKPSERAPRTQARLIELAVEAARGLPGIDGTIESRSASREEGRRVLADERFDHVVFTGSTGVGRAIAEVCAARLIPTTLELSGSDSAIVLSDADARAAARAVFMGFTANAGQTCMAPRRALVARPALAAFTDELARLVAGALEPPNGRAMRPIAVLDCPAEGALFVGAHFGPALAVRAFDSLEEALALHARAGQYLATSVWTRRPRAEPAERLAGRLACAGSGLVHFNSVLLPSAHPGVSISGHGASGWGASRGEGGLLALTREVFVTRTSALLAPPADEPSAKVQSFLSKFLRWPLRAPAQAAPATGSRPVSPREEPSLRA